jgi:putative transcription factor
MVPDLKLARKIEKIMHVVLIEKSDDISADGTGNSNVKGATIGDIARIKRN